MKIKVVIPTTDAGGSMTRNCIMSLGLAEPSLTSEDIIITQGNQGFSKTVNAGVRKAKENGADIVLLVNSDILFTKPILKRIEKRFEEDAALGVVGAKLFYPNGKLQHAGGWQYAEDGGHHAYHSDEKDVDWLVGPIAFQFVTGALIAFRVEVWDKIEGFDERFFLAFEDSTFCFKAWEAGYRVILDPEVEAIHAEGATRGERSDAHVMKKAYYKIRQDEGCQLFSGIKEGLDWHKINTEVWKANGCPEEDIVCMPGAMGDVIALTAAIHAYKVANPTHDIYVRTGFPHVFEGNPDVIDAGPDIQRPLARIIDCSRQRQLHPEVDHSTSYCAPFGIEPPTQWELTRPRLHSVPEDMANLLKKMGVDGIQKRYAVVHAGKTHWRNRDYPELMYRKVCHGLLGAGFVVCIVGHGKDMLPDHPGLADFRKKATLPELRELIRGASVYVGPDSGPAWVAMTTDTPTVLLFSSTLPEQTLPTGYPWKSITSNAECVGCLHREPPPVYWLECPESNRYKCVDGFNAEAIIETAKEIAR